VAIGEQGAAGSESIDIRRDGVGVAIETADPVVHVVDRDKENVGSSFVSVRRLGESGEGYRREQGEEDVFHRNQARRSLMTWPWTFVSLRSIPLW